MPLGLTAIIHLQSNVTCTDEYFCTVSVMYDRLSTVLLWVYIAMKAQGKVTAQSSV